MQVKLLRVLETREFMRVGGTETIRVDIRLVAATNSDLEAAVLKGAFRSDLYYRLKVVTLRIPPLRERREDIPLLVNHFFATFIKENGREGMRITHEAMRALVAGPWEGNVREVRNQVESLVVLTPGNEIRVEDLSPEIRSLASDGPPSTGRPAPVSEAALKPGSTAGLTMDEIERRAIEDALERTGGNRTQAAEMLGIGLRTLQRKLKDYRAAGRAAAGDAGEGNDDEPEG
jgi:DNA-binding NtrC family response regulator